MPTSPRCKRWCFTLNNYTFDEHTSIKDVFSSLSCDYLVIGKEVAPTTGTPHLQGFIIFNAPVTLPYLRRNLSQRAHFEPARGPSCVAAEYCKKDGDFEEFGAVPTVSGQGRRSDLAQARERIDEFIRDNERAPTERELARLVPNCFIRFHKGLLRYARAVAPAPVIRREDAELRPWQDELAQELDDPADDRSIIFYVDEEGGSGKTWFQQWFISKFPEKTQILSVAKRDDLAFAIDETKNVFFFNVPRGQMEYIQYSVLESLKDRLVFSPKYESALKVLTKNAHVIVFSNEMPDESKLSHDRLIVRDPSS